jgi:hypothetical protein
VVMMSGFREVDEAVARDLLVPPTHLHWAALSFLYFGGCFSSCFLYLTPAALSLLMFHSGEYFLFLHCSVIF